MQSERVVKHSTESERHRIDALGLSIRHSFFQSKDYSEYLCEDPAYSHMAARVDRRIGSIEQCRDAYKHPVKVCL